MVATPEAIAKYTEDGQLLIANDVDLLAAHPDAKDAGDINTMFRFVADGQAMLDLRAAMLKKVGALHEMVEVTDELGVGTTIPVAPQVPTFTVIDASRDLKGLGRVRAVAIDFTIDRYSIELVG